MDRRGFLGSVLALGAAPAIVRADSLMRIVVPQLVVPASSNNEIITLAKLTAEALRVLEQNLQFSMFVGQEWSDEFKAQKHGTLVYRPNRILTLRN